MERYRRWLATYPDELPRAVETELDEAIAAMDSRNEELYGRLNVTDVDRWDIDQDEGKLTLRLEDGRTIIASVQIVGSHDGETWKWAWDNPSVLPSLSADAKRAREWGQANARGHLTLARWAATPMDGWGLTALAAKLAEAQGTYVARSGDTLVYMALHDAKGAVRGPSVTADASGLFDMIHDLLAAPPPTEIPLALHRQVQELCDRGLEAASRDHAQARHHFEQAWQMLPDYKYEQAPAGWIRLAIGESYFSSGDCAQARETLEDARTHRAEGLDHLRADVLLARCLRRLGDETGAQTALLRAYVRGGSGVDADLPSEEQALLREALEASDRSVAAEIAGSSDDLGQTRTVVETLIRRMHEFEVSAWERSEAARKRNPSSTLSQEETELREQLDLEWLDILVRYFTPERAPGVGSYGSPPSHDPEREKIKKADRMEGGAVQVRTETPSALGTDYWRYVLVKTRDIWRVQQAWSSSAEAEAGFRIH